MDALNTSTTSLPISLTTHAVANNDGKSIKSDEVKNNDVVARQSSNKGDAVKTAAPTKEELKKATEAADKVFSGTGTSLQFHIDDSTKEPVIKIVDTTDGRVIKQIPSDQMLALAKSITEMQDRIGKLFKEKV